MITAQGMRIRSLRRKLKGPNPLFWQNCLEEAKRDLVYHENGLITAKRRIKEAEKELDIERKREEFERSLQQL